MSLAKVIDSVPAFTANVKDGNAILIADGGLRVNTSLFPVGEFVPVKIDFTKEINLQERNSNSTNPRMKATNGGVKTVINGSMYLEVNGVTVETPISGSQVIALCLIQKTRTGAGATIGDCFAKSRTVISQGRELVVLDIYCEGKEDKHRPFYVVPESEGNPFVRFNGKDTDVSLFGISLTVKETEQEPVKSAA
jgi:hypothetical protein